MGYESQWQLERKCWRKKGWWHTLKAAHKRANVIFKKSGLKLYPYYCSHCGKVHLTKQESAKGKTL